MLLAPVAAQRVDQAERLRAASPVSAWVVALAARGVPGALVVSE